MVGQGTAQLAINAPDGTTAWSAEAGEITSFLFEVPYQAGTWNAELQGVAVDPSEAAFFADVQIVSVYDRSGAV